MLKKELKVQGLKKSSKRETDLKLNNPKRAKSSNPEVKAAERAEPLTAKG